MPDSGTLGTTIRSRRRALGLTQRDLSELAEVSERFVHALEQGKDTAQLAKVLDVLRVLGLGLAVVSGDGSITNLLDHPTESSP